MDKIVLEKFLNQKVALVRDNDFVEYGKIVEIYDSCISFYIQKLGKTIFIDFSRIVEIRPQQGGCNDRDFTR